MVKQNYQTVFASLKPCSSQPSYYIDSYLYYLNNLNDYLQSILENPQKNCSFIHFEPFVAQQDNAQSASVDHLFSSLYYNINRCILANHFSLLPMDDQESTSP